MSSRWRRTPRAAGWLLGGLLLALGLLAAAEWAVHRQRVQWTGEVEADVQRLGRASEDHTRLLLQLADRSLRQIARARLDGAGADTLGVMLRMAADQPRVRNVVITDARGMVTGSAGESGPVQPGQSLAQRPYIATSLRETAQSLHVGVPMTSLNSRLWTMYLSRGIAGSDGALLGVVALGLDPHALLDFYKDLGLGRRDQLLLFGEDGRTRLNVIGPEEQPSEGDAAPPRAVPTTAEGLRRERADGRERVVAWRRLTDVALVVSVAVDLDDALAARAQSAGTVRALGGTAALVTLLLAAALARRSQRAAAHQQAMVEASQLGGLLAASPVGIALHGVDGTLRYANPAWSDGPGGLAAHEADTRSAIARAAATLQPVLRPHVEGEGERARVTQLLSFPLPDAGGTVEAVGTIALDVTEHHHNARRLAEREDELLLITNHLGPIARLDADLRFLHANNVFVRAFAREGVALAVGHFAAEVLDDEAFALMRMALRGALAGQRHDFEMRVDRLSREPRQYLISALPDPKGDGSGRPGVSLLGFDITERKRSEDAVLRLNVELEQRVRSRTEELRASNAQLSTSLESLQRAQAQLVQQEKLASLGGLVAGVAHEINTPVGIVVTAASHLDMQLDALRRQLADNSLRRSDLEAFLDGAAESMAIVLANLQRASDLVRSFKLVAVDQTSDLRRPFQLRAYLDEILRNLSPQLQRTQHVVRVDCDPNLVLHSHPGAFSQIVTNLVMNSLQHGFDGIERGTIRIEVHEDADGLLLRYADDGRGIAVEHLPQLFDPFFTTRRGHGGSGLGLHIVFNLVTQRLGGRIECRSEPGAGACFEIRLPPSSYAAENG